MPSSLSLRLALILTIVLRLAPVLGLASLVPTFTRAADGPAWRVSLRNLPGVAVEVPPIENAGEEAGVSTVGLQQMVHERLRIAGIHVLSREAQQQSRQRPILRFNVCAARLASGEYLYTIRLEMVQWVALLNNPELTVATAVPVPAATWSSQVVVGIAPEEHLREDLETAVAPLVSQFVTAHQRANPTQAAVRSAPEIP